MPNKTMSNSDSNFGIYLKNTNEIDDEWNVQLNGKYKENMHQNLNGWIKLLLLLLQIWKNTLNC